MPYTIVRQRIENFPRWRRAFEGHADARAERGSKGGHLFRNPEDRKEIVVFLAWEDLEKAREYLSSSDDVREEREKGEVSGDPEVLYLEELGRPRR